jgi:hypothetical protein
MIVQDVLQYALIFIALLATFRLVKAYLERRSTSPRELREVADRLARLEHAVDVVAVEVERLSESQRFVARLLAEQRPALHELRASEQASVNG